jgi:hypothetical protein
VGYERVERAFHGRPDQVVDDPPGDLRVGARLLRWVDVDAAQQPRLALVEQGVVEGLVRLDLRLVPGEVLTVLLTRHVLGRPGPGLAVDRPQALP